MPKIAGIDVITTTPSTMRGILPLGSIIPVMSNITGSHSLPASGVATFGLMRADGSVIPGGQTLSGNTPNLTSGRFLYGTSGSGVGVYQVGHG